MGTHDNNYNASIHLQLVVPIGHDYGTELFELQVKLVDVIHPWISHYTDGKKADSIGWMSGVTMKEGGGIDRLYEVEIRPPFLLTPEKTYAYERYGDQLAKSLSEIVTKDVLSVKSRIEINGCFSSGYRPRDL